MVKAYAIGGLALLVLTLGFGWYRTEIRRAEARGARNEIVKDYEALKLTYTAFRDSAVRADSVRAAELTQSKLAQDALEDELLTVRADARANLSALRRRLATDTVPVAEVEAVLTVLEEEAETCSLALANCGLVTAQLEERVSGLTRQGVEAQALISEQQLTIETLQIEPGRDLLPWAIAVVALVFAGLAIIF